MSGDGPAVELASRRLTTFLKHQRFAYVLHGRNLIGRLLSKMAGTAFSVFPRLAATRARFESRILDVGCGPGHLLQALQRQGFAGVLGQDKFQQEFVPGVPVERKPLEELDGSFDVIMLHHSFEHMPDPVPTLRALKRLCDPGGTILLRIPVVGCEAWKEYGVNWYQIDAPRHLVIPSERGLRLVAQQLGLDIARVEYDSNETQFGCSEQYAQDVPLRDARSFYFDPHTDLFTDEQKAVFRSRAAQANAAGKGDQACFYLTHAWDYRVLKTRNARPVLGQVGLVDVANCVLHDIAHAGRQSTSSTCARSSNVSELERQPEQQTLRRVAHQSGLASARSAPPTPRSRSIHSAKRATSAGS